VRHEFTPSTSADFLYQYNSENALIARGTSDAAYRPAETNPGLVPGSTGYVANALNQYTSVGAAALSYDGNGNLAGDGVWSYRYDPQNRLLSASKTAGGVVNIAYGYDAVGRRRSRVQGAAATRFLWAGEQEIAEYNSAGALVRRFVPGPALDEPVAAVTPAPGVTRRFNHTDALGSVVAVSIATGVGTSVLMRRAPHSTRIVASASRATDRNSRRCNSRSTSRLAAISASGWMIQASAARPK